MRFEPDTWKIADVLESKDACMAELTERVHGAPEMRPFTTWRWTDGIHGSLSRVSEKDGNTVIARVKLKCLPASMRP